MAMVFLIVEMNRGSCVATAAAGFYEVSALLVCVPGFELLKLLMEEL